MKAATIAIAIVLVVSPAFAQKGASTPHVYTGNSLINECPSALALGKIEMPDETYNAGYCVGLVRGVSATLIAIGVIALPEAYTTEQGIRVVMKYLQDHPADLAREDVGLVGKALMEAFPAKK
jgi:hypothetical protein